MVSISGKIKKHQFDACFPAGSSVKLLTILSASGILQATGEGSNHFSYINPESDKLLEANRLSLMNPKRIEILKKWQKVVYDDQW